MGKIPSRPAMDRRRANSRWAGSGSSVTWISAALETSGKLDRTSRTGTPAVTGMTADSEENARPSKARVGGVFPSRIPSSNSGKGSITRISATPECGGVQDHHTVPRSPSQGTAAMSASPRAPKTCPVTDRFVPDSSIAEANSSLARAGKNVTRSRSSGSGPKNCPSPAAICSTSPAFVPITELVPGPISPAATHWPQAAPRNTRTCERGNPDDSHSNFNDPAPGAVQVHQTLPLIPASHAGSPGSSEEPPTRNSKLPPAGGIDSRRTKSSFGGGTRNSTVD